MEFLRTKPLRSGQISDQEKCLREIEKKYGVSLTLHDLYGKLRNITGEPLLPGRNVHPHECCLRGRYQFPFWNTKCYEDCFTDTEKKLELDPVPHLKRCWKNLVELVVPVCRRGTHQLTFFAGVFRPDTPSPENLPEWFRTRYESLPEITQTAFSELAVLLRIIGTGFLDEAESTLSAPAPDGRLVLIQEYIRKHAHECVSLATLGAELFLSPSRTGHLVRELSGKSFLELLEEERMLRAKALLLGSGRKLSDIAASVGYPNEYYFNRVFTRFFRISPGKFRKENLKKCLFT